MNTQRRRTLSVLLSSTLALVGWSVPAAAQHVGTYEGLGQPGNQPVQVDLAYDNERGQLFVAGLRLPTYALICMGDGGYIQPTHVDTSGVHGPACQVMVC